LESVIHKLRIHTLQAQLALRQHLCASLAKEFEAGNLTVEQKAALAHRWDDTLKESWVLQLMIDLLERQEKEGRVGTR
jgi:hypothetical protein